MGFPPWGTGNCVTNGGEFCAKTIEELTGYLDIREENGVVCQLRCPSFEFGREFIDGHFWWTEEFIEGDEFVGVVRLRPFRIKNG